MRSLLKLEVKKYKLNVPINASGSVGKRRGGCRAVDPKVEKLDFHQRMSGEI